MIDIASIDTVSTRSGHRNSQNQVCRAPFLVHALIRSHQVYVDRTSSFSLVSGMFRRFIPRKFYFSRVVRFCGLRTLASPCNLLKPRAALYNSPVQAPPHYALPRNFGTFFSNAFLMPTRCVATSTVKRTEVLLNDNSVQRIKQLMRKHGPNASLRLEVEPGGCSGFKYNFRIDTEQPGEEDRMIEREGARLLVDSVSLEYVKGATVGYQTELAKQAFVVLENPNVDSACGCKVSFNVKAKPVAAAASS